MSGHFMDEETGGMHFARVHPHTVYIFGELFEEMAIIVGFWFFILSRKCKKTFEREWKRSCVFYKSLIVLGVISAVFCAVVLPIMVAYMIYFEGI